MLGLDFLHDFRFSAEQSDQGRLTRSPLNDATAFATRTGQELARQLQHLPEPIEHHHFQLRARRTRNLMRFR